MLALFGSFLVYVFLSHFYGTEFSNLFLKNSITDQVQIEKASQEKFFLKKPNQW